MAELGKYYETTSLGRNKYQTTIGIKPVNYQDGSTWKRMSSDFAASGIPARPNMVDRAQLMVSVAGNGDYRIHPTRDKDRYLDFGAPLLKVGGQWRRQALGGVARASNRLSWNTANEEAYIVHAGHYVKWGILLKRNFDKWAQFAMPMETHGLTRSKDVMFADGAPVMHMRKPIAYDYDNPDDVRQIAHEIVRIDGKWHVVFTLPSLAGMSKPLIDPTLELRPDAAAGKDAESRVSDPDTSYGTAVNMYLSSDESRIPLVYYDISSIPTSATVTSAVFTPYIMSNESDITTNWYAILVANDGWLEACTWNYADGAGASDRWAGDTGNDGGADAGCSVSGTDYNAVAMGTRSGFTGSIDDPLDITLDNTAVQGWVDDPSTNYGMVGHASTTITLGTSDRVTESRRPKLVVNYTEAAGGIASMTRAPMWGRF